MMMVGADLKKWRERNNYTQERLRLALGVTRQTIVSWEQSQKPLARLVQLALLALEHRLTDEAAGKRLTTAEYRYQRNRPDDVGAHAQRPDYK